MSIMENVKLRKAVYMLLFLFLLFAGLFYARSFLVPLTFAGLLSMLLLPVSVKLEQKGWNKILAIIVCILILVLFFAGVATLLAWQVSDMAQNASEIEKNITQKINQVKEYLTNSFGIPRQKQEQIIQQQQSSSQKSMGANFTAAFASVGTLLANFLLVLVYVFLFMYFRQHLKNFVLKIVPADKQQKAVKTIEDCRKVAQKYITGLATMIVCLWVMYGIGFSIVGVKNTVFFAILCGLLEIVPFVGNITGTVLTMFVSLAQGGDMSLVIGIAATYAIVQFIQTYLLEPLIVGSEVNINPLFTIASIVAGELVWGIPGMVLAIPIMGITKIVCDNVEELKPFGYLLGENKKKGKTGVIDKIKGWFKSGKDS